MSERAVSRMSPEEFLEWGLHQDRRYELIHGVPVAMAGSNQAHDTVVGNALGMLYGQLRGQTCRKFTADIAVRIPAGNIRRADAGIDCGPYDRNATSASAPFLVLEVLSPSTRDFDMFGKLEEYKSVATLRHIVLVDPDTPQVFHWSRPDGGAWRHVLLEGLDAVIEFPEIEVSLDLASLYEGLTFRQYPRLVEADDAHSDYGRQFTVDSRMSPREPDPEWPLPYASSKIAWGMPDQLPATSIPVTEEMLTKPLDLTTYFQMLATRVQWMVEQNESADDPLAELARMLSDRTPWGFSLTFDNPRAAVKEMIEDNIYFHDLFCRATNLYLPDSIIRIDPAAKDAINGTSVWDWLDVAMGESRYDG